MQKQKKYSLRKITGYGLVSCAIGFMLVSGLTQVDADEVNSVTSSLDNISSSPYVSVKAKQSLQLAIEQISNRNAFIAVQSVMEDTAQNLDVDKQTGVQAIKSAFDELPETIRKFVRGVSFYQAVNGQFGDTDSINGVSRLNTNYYNINSFDQSLETLFHEVSHSIDGKTFTNNGVEYSLSRDEKIVPLLQKINSNAPVFETWSNLFAEYTMSRIYNKVVTDDNHKLAMIYFDELLGEAIFGSKAYDDNGVLITANQSGVTATMTEQGLKLTIDNAKKFQLGERIVVKVTGDKINAYNGFLSSGDVKIEGQKVGYASLNYVSSNGIDKQTDQLVAQLNSTPLKPLSESEFNQLMDLLTKPTIYTGYLTITLDANKINQLKDRSILFKLNPEYTGTNAEAIHWQGRQPSGLKRLINHDVIDNFVTSNASDWEWDLKLYAGHLDRIRSTSDNMFEGTISYNNQVVSSYKNSNSIDLEYVTSDKTNGGSTDRDNLINYYNYDLLRGRENIDSEPEYEGYKDLLEDWTNPVIPSTIIPLGNGYTTSKERIFKPGDMKHEFFLNGTYSGLSIKPELIGTTQHVSKDVVNSYDTPQVVNWSDDKTWAEYSLPEKIENITSHYEWDVKYEEDKITIVNTNEIHVPQHAILANLGPDITIGNQLQFKPKVVFDDVANWTFEPNAYWSQGSYHTSNISAYSHSTYYDSLNDERKEFTTQPDSYEIRKRKASGIIAEGDKIPHNVSVQFVDEKGNTIAPEKIINEGVFSTDIYHYEPETIDGYRYLKLADDSAPLQGLVGYQDRMIKLVYQDASQPIQSKESTTFHWTIHFKDMAGNTLRDDATITNTYERTVTTMPDGSQTFGDWTFVNQTTDKADGLNVQNAEVVSTDGEISKATSVLSLPGQIGDYYRSLFNGKAIDPKGTSSRLSLDDLIYNAKDRQADDVYGEVLSNYQQKDATIHLQLVDADAPSKIYQSKDIATFKNYTQSLDTHLFDSYASKGEMLDTIPLSVAMSDGDQTIQIRINAKTTSKTEHRTTTRLILRSISSARDISQPGEKDLETISQDVEWTRTKTTNLISGQSTYSDWNSDSPVYLAYAVPEIEGYDHFIVKMVEYLGYDLNAVPEEKADPENGGLLHFVVYTPLEQSINLKIVNDRNETLATLPINGLTNQKVTIDSSQIKDLDAIKEKYDLDELPTTYTFKTQDNQDIVIHAKDKLKEESTTRDSTREIYIQSPGEDNFTLTKAQTVQFAGTKVTNLATNEITYKDWHVATGSNDKFDEFTIPQIAGYRAYNFDDSNKSTLTSLNEVSNLTQDSGTSSIRIAYEAQPQDVKVQLVDENNHIIAEKSMSALTDSDIHYDMNELFNQFSDVYFTKDSLTGTHKVTARDNVIRIQLRRRSNTSQQTKTITRTIHITQPNGETKTVQQTVTFTRYEITNVETGEKSYTDWKSTHSSFDEYSVPVVDDYVANLTTINAETATPDMEDQTIEVSYSAKVDTTTEDKDFVRTIIVQKPDGQKDTIYQKVHGSRTRTTNNVTGEVTYSDWNLDKPAFDSYTSQQIDGFDAKTIDALSVDVNETDPIVEYVTYKTITVDSETQTNNPTTSDEGTQTDNSATTDAGTQTKVEIPVTYKFEDGTVYKFFTITEDKGYILDGSDLEMLPDNMDFADDFVTYEVKGDGTDAIVRIVKKNVVDQGSQAESPSTNDGSTQTEEPTTSDDGTQTDNPDTTDAEKQTNSLPLAEKKLTKTQNNKPNLLQKHKTQYTSSNRGANKLPQAGSKEQSTLGILGVSMLVIGGIVRIFKRKKYTN